MLSTPTRRGVPSDRYARLATGVTGRHRVTGNRAQIGLLRALDYGSRAAYLKGVPDSAGCQRVLCTFGDGTDWPKYSLAPLTRGTAVDNPATTQATNIRSVIDRPTRSGRPTDRREYGVYPKQYRDTSLTSQPRSLPPRAVKHRQKHFR